MLAGSVVAEALNLSWCVASEVLDALEIESRILWNFRFVVIRALGIGRKKQWQSEHWLRIGRLLLRYIFAAVSLIAPSLRHSKDI